MIRAEMEDARMEEFNGIQKSVQRVTIEFDVLTESAMEVMVDVLKATVSRLERPVATLLGPFQPNIYGQTP